MASSSPAAFARPRPATEVPFDRICREHGITHRLTGVRSLTTTGRIERFHQSLRVELPDDHPPFADRAAAQATIDAWRDDDNTARPHHSLGMATPACRFRPAPADGLRCDCPPVLSRSPREPPRRDPERPTSGRIRSVMGYVELA
jgi:hypothetical protein